MDREYIYVEEIREKREIGEILGLFPFNNQNIGGFDKNQLEKVWLIMIEVRFSGG